MFPGETDQNSRSVRDSNKATGTYLMVRLYDDSANAEGCR